ncbi:signal recognition particle-docking protein FtsY [Candidatus Woesearchaeota archaeon]|nr:signal recognition particle-docking protein FtsY [Candidatus Woesearchaeota archaeon]
MFKALREKLKSVISKASKKVEEEAEVVKEVKETDQVTEAEELPLEGAIEEPVVEAVPEEISEEPAIAKEPVHVKPKIIEPDVVEAELEAEPEVSDEFDVIEKPQVEVEELKIKKQEPKIEKRPAQKHTELAAEPAKPKRFFAKIKQRISERILSEKQFDAIFEELEIVLLENNVAVEVVEEIKSNLLHRLVGRPLLKGEINEVIISTLRKSIENLFDVESVDLIENIKEKKEKPYVICFVGVNGSGKTTSLAKLAHMLKQNHISCVLAASDTFRAAAIQQLEVHAKRLNVKMIKHDYGADSSAVAFDAIQYAKAHDVGVVLIDTAGRLHSNVNLMDEMKKMKRVAKPDLIVFVGESITGNDCVEQARTFNEEIGIDGIILSKADVDEKGGAAISISFITKKPIMYLGVGQEYKDLIEFNPEIVVQGLGLEA